MSLSQPILLNYSKPTASFLDSLKKGSACIEVKDEPRIILAKSYYRLGITGALERVFLRARVFEALKEALNMLPLGQTQFR